MEKEEKEKGEKEEKKDTQKKGDHPWQIPFESFTVGKTVLGYGSFGAVYLGDYEGAEAAIKVLSAPFKIPERYIIDEMRNLQAIRHPNVLGFLGVCVKDNSIYILTEYVPGGNLWDKIPKNPASLSLTLRVLYLLQSLITLNYC